jgi:hypothetical protein
MKLFPLNFIFIFCAIYGDLVPFLELAQLHLDLLKLLNGCFLFLVKNFVLLIGVCQKIFEVIFFSLQVFDSFLVNFVHPFCFLKLREHACNVEIELLGLAGFCLDPLGHLDAVVCYQNL